MAKKKKSLLAVVGVALSALLTVGIVSSAFPAEEKCDHVFDEGKVVVEATCSSDGKKVLTCSDCGETAVLSISAGPHDFVFNGIDDARCSFCNKSVSSMNVTDLDSPIVKSGWYRLDDVDFDGLTLISGLVSPVNSDEYQSDAISISISYEGINSGVVLSGFETLPSGAKLSCDSSFAGFLGHDDYYYFYLDVESFIPVKVDTGESLYGSFAFLSFVNYENLDFMNNG